MRLLKQPHRSRIPFRLHTLSILSVLAGCASPDASDTAIADATLFEGARIIDGNGGEPIENGAFVVENGRFTRVGATGEVEAPEGARRVDLTGKTVMPAIVNAHVHLGSTRDELIDQLEQFAYFGVGAVQSLGHDSSAAAFELRNEVIPGAARYRTSGRGITGPEPGRSEVPYWITSEDEARAAVRELAGRDIELVKIWVDDRNGQYEKLSAPLYTAVVDEAHRHGQRVAAHIFALEDAKGLLRAGVDAFAHGVRDTDIDDEGLALFRERTEFVLIPNLPDRGVATDPGWLAGSIPAEQLEQLRARTIGDSAVRQRFAVQARNLAKLDQAGVRIAMGTDGSSPWAAHVEMEDMVAAGMSPSRVIVAATRNSAELLRLDDAGTVEAGKSADFIVLDANPLEDITNTRRISDVYLRGAALDRGALRARLTGGTATGS